MSPPESHPLEIDPAILKQAADWLMHLSSGEPDAGERDALAHWLAQDPRHRLAWQRAEALLADFKWLPPDIAKATLDRPAPRRRMLARLLWLPLAPTAAWLGWRTLVPEAQADLRTATGEQRQLTLPDGTLLTLNTATAVDVHYTPQQRLIRLIAGEIMVATAADPAPTSAAPRPFLVQTAEGTARALGTRFTVRRLEYTPAQENRSRSRVAVFDGAVEITAGGLRQRVNRGEQAEFTPSAITPPHFADEAIDGAWNNGMLIARQMRLADLAAELDRYRPGILRCHPDVAELRISGAFPVIDPDRSLRLLETTFPLRIRYLTRYWATLEPAQG